MSKPEYSIPSMAEISAIPWNGFNAVSTFSGCGGSSLGYKMAGFRVLWASEFIHAAQDTYRANHKETILDTRDIRLVKAQEILDATGMKSGEIDLLDGSPPCAAFSTAGKREAGWGKVRKYSETKQRVDDLFFEFIRIISGVKPKVFVAENVSGLIKGTAKGYFLEILSAMKSAGYRVKCRLLDAQWLGVPQLRQRTIFIGVREDLGIDPVYPKPLPYQYTVRDACVEIDKIIYGGRFGVTYIKSADSVQFQCIGVSPSSGNGRAGKVKRFGEIGYSNLSTSELKRACAFPDDFQLTGTCSQQWERLGRAVPPVMMSHIARTIRDEILCRIKK